MVIGILDILSAGYCSKGISQCPGILGISLFSPLIKKYAGKLFYMDAEDAEQEMKLAFLIAVHSMSY